VNKIKQFITARRISLGLILALAGLMYVTTLIPQELDSTPQKIEAWRRGHESLLWLVNSANLHRIHAQPWFAAVILFAALALGVSSCDQLAASRKKLYSTGTGAGEEVASSVSRQKLCFVARSYRYHALQTGSQEELKFVKNPWGYFGNLLLHLGMLLVIIASFYVALTARQGSLILIEGEQRGNRQTWDASEQGILSKPLKLPGAIRLDKVTVNFDSKNQPAEVFSDISITDDSGRVASLTASINRNLQYHHLRIYHTAQYGDAFTVTFADNRGIEHVEKIAVQQPVSLIKAGYSEDFGVIWSPHLFSAKYFADVDKKSMASANPEFILRLTSGKNELARTTLTKGSTGTLGEYRVKLTRVEKWAKLIIVDISGMPLIFAGFAIIMLGGLIHYLTPPRELIGMRQQNGSFLVYWKATAFSTFYEEERDALAKELNKELP
jgi:hypothetical protein